jgi:hypothetical protein
LQRPTWHFFRLNKQCIFTVNILLKRASTK